MKNSHMQDPFQAIADPSRREILFLLAKTSYTINALADNFEMSRPAVSKHIKLLYGAGFITIEDKGRERYCSLKQDGFEELQNWMNFFDRFWNKKLDALGAYLEKNEPVKKKKSKNKLIKINK